MARYSWCWDQVKNPLPLTPLSQDFFNTKREGMARTARQTGRPADSERIFVNGYAFARPVEPSADEAERYSTIAERDAESRIDRLLELWGELKKQGVTGQVADTLDAMRGGPQMAQREILKAQRAAGRKRVNQSVHALGQE